MAIGPQLLQLSPSRDKPPAIGYHHPMEHLPIIAGILGSALALVVYACLSSGRLSANDLRYPLLNMVATLGVLCSLMAQWNLPSLLLNLSYVLISLVGVIRILRLRNRPCTRS